MRFAYEEELARMPMKYRIQDVRIPLRRKILRGIETIGRNVKTLFRKIVSGKPRG